MNLTSVDLVSVLQQGGYVGILALFIIALSRKWIVFGYQLKDCEEREQDWKNMALSNQGVTGRTLDIADELRRGVTDAFQRWDEVARLQAPTDRPDARPPPRRRR